MSEVVPGPVALQQLEHMLAMSRFTRAKRAAEILGSVVVGTVNGRPPTRHELGVTIFNRPADWNEDADTIVRTNLVRLSAHLEEYYSNEGCNDPVKIAIKPPATAVLEFNPKSTIPPSLDLDFTTTLENHFGDQLLGSLRCIVTGEPAGWYHLDGDRLNNAAGNLIPLSDHLRLNLEELHTGKRVCLLPELSPEMLIKLAATHFSRWKASAAYGCAHLAFCLDEAPFGEESDDVRLLRFCQALHYARHTFKESIAAYLIRNSLLPFISRVEILDPRPIFRLALQLSALLDESAYFELAVSALMLAKSLSHRYPDIVSPDGSIYRFSLPRREAQLLMQRDPAATACKSLLAQANEQASDNVNRAITMELLQCSHSFHIGTAPASRKAYERLAPLVSRYEGSTFAKTGINISGDVTASAVTEIFLMSGIAASRIRPLGWEAHAREMAERARVLCQRSGFRIIPEFWNTAVRETFEANPKSQPAFFPLAEYVEPVLRVGTVRDIEIVLKCLKRITCRPSQDVAA